VSRGELIQGGLRVVDRVSTAFAGDSGVLEWVSLSCDVRVERQRPSRGDGAADGLPPLIFNCRRAVRGLLLEVLLSASARVVRTVVTMQCNFCSFRGITQCCADKGTAVRI
jgi:hypothetical protein